MFESVPKLNLTLRYLLGGLAALGVCSSFYLVGGVTPLKVAFAALLVISAPIAVQASLQWRPTRSDGALYLFGLLALTSIAWSPDKSLSLRYMSSLGMGLCLYTILRVMLESDPRLREPLWRSLVLVGIASSLLGLVQAATGSFFMPGTPTRSTATAGQFRANGFFQDPNYLGMAVCAIWPYLLRIRSVAYRVGGLLVAFASIAATFSRASLLVLIVQFLLMGQIGKRVRPRTILTAIFAAVTAIGVIAVLIYLDLLGMRERVFTLAPLLSGSVETVENSALERLDLLLAGWGMFLDHPLLGVGFGGFEYFSAEYMRFVPRSVLAHNTYLTILAEQGLLGGVTFGIFLASVWKRAGRESKLSLLGLLGSMFFLVAHYMPLAMFLFALFLSDRQRVLPGMKDVVRSE